MLLSALFSGSEAALFSLTDLHLDRMSEQSAPALRTIRSLLERPRRLLITILSGNEISNVSISAVAGGLGLRLHLPSWLVIGVTTLCLMVLCEVFPKTVARRWPERWSSIASTPLTGLVWGLTPLRIVLEGLVRIVERSPENGAHESAGLIGEDEFLMLVGLGLQDGALRAREGHLIEAVFDLGNTAVERIMTPRTELFALPVGTRLADALANLHDNPYTRIPVFGADLDDIRGILYASDLIREITRNGEGKTVESICRRPVYVPENKQVSELFAMLRRKKIHMVVVVDEYGGISGIATLDDILTKLFGEIRDEHDEPGEDEEAVRLDGGVVVAPGRMTVDEFNEFVGSAIRGRGNETIAGVVFSRLGHLPKAGEIVGVDGYLFKVLELDGTRIARVRVSPERETDA